MESMRALNARVGACRLLLDQHEQGSAIYTALSSLQSAAICEMIAVTVMTADIRSEVGSRVVQVKWGSPNDCTAILTALAAGNASLVPAGKRRRLQQDFCNIVHYGTAMLWEQMASEVPSSSKLTLLLDLLISLGCRCPSEHSVKLLCSLWLMVSEPAEQLLQMTLDQKKVMLCHVKHTFEGVRKASVDPPQWITALPLPLIFLRDYEGMYHAAFSGGQVPVQAKIDLKALTMLDLSYSCRGGARSVVPMMGGMPSSSSSSSSAMGLQVAPCDSPLERMANTFMSRMESMATSQQRMMELMLGGTARGIGSSGPRSLLALENNDPASAVRRVPSFAFNPPQLALPDGAAFENVVVAVAEASPATPLAQLTLQPAPMATVPAAMTPPAQASAASHVDAMLDMLSKREESRKNSKVEAKKNLKAEEAAAPIPSAIADANAKAVAAPPPAKANAQAKAKAMTAAKAKAMVDAKAKPKAGVKAPPPPVLNAAAKAKAKASVNAKAVAKKPPAKAAAVVLGCSKCRHRPGGCAQCRNPEFLGFRWSV
jgi:hypothetical protein